MENKHSKLSKMNSIMTNLLQQYLFSTFPSPHFFHHRTFGLTCVCAVDTICGYWFLNLQEVTCCYHMMLPTCKVACCSFKDEAIEDILPHCSNATLLIPFWRKIVLKTLQGWCRVSDTLFYKQDRPRSKVQIFQIWNVIYSSCGPLLSINSISLLILNRQIKIKDK